MDSSTLLFGEEGGNLIITEIYFTLSRVSRTNSQENSTHASGTRQQNRDNAAARKRRYKCLNNANADTGAKEYNMVGSMTIHPGVGEWVTHRSVPHGVVVGQAEQLV